MKEPKNNGAAIKSIWKTAEKDSGNNQNSHRPKRGSRAYRDPTANAAIANIMREEKRKKRMEQQAANQNRAAKRAQ